MGGRVGDAACVGLGIVVWVWRAVVVVVVLGVVLVGGVPSAALANGPRASAIHPSATTSQAGLRRLNGIGRGPNR